MLLSSKMQRPFHLNAASSLIDPLDTEEYSDAELDSLTTFPGNKPGDSVTLTKPKDSRPPRKGLSKVETALGIAAAAGGLAALAAGLPGNGQIQNPLPTVTPPTSVVVEAQAQTVNTTNSFEASMLQYEFQQAEQRYGMPAGYLQALAWDRTEWNVNHQGQGFGILNLKPSDPQHSEFFANGGDWQDPIQSIEFAAAKVAENYGYSGDWDLSFTIFAGETGAYSSILKAYSEITPWAP